MLVRLLSEVAFLGPILWAKNINLNYYYLEESKYRWWQEMEEEWDEDAEFDDDWEDDW
ncbi:MAG: hypothetical protein ACFFBS_08420 [Promethearchaeota archaeon]